MSDNHAYVLVSLTSQLQELALRLQTASPNREQLLTEMAMLKTNVGTLESLLSQDVKVIGGHR